MSDLIDRDLLIKSIDYICTPGGIWAKPFEAYKEAFKEFVKGMPSVKKDAPDTNVGKWTLTTTAQPKKAGYYLSTCIDSQWGVTANEAKRYLSVCYYEPIPGHHWYDPLRGTVVAWMPLPEMFQGSLDEYVQARRDEYYRRMSEEVDTKLNK